MSTARSRMSLNLMNKLNLVKTSEHRPFDEALEHYNFTRSTAEEFKTELERFIVLTESLNETMLRLFGISDKFYRMSGDPNHGLASAMQAYAQEALDGTQQNLLDGLRQGVLQPTLSYLRELETFETSIKTFQEHRLTYDHYVRKVNEISNAISASPNSRQSVSISNTERLVRNVVKLQDCTKEYRTVSDDVCRRLLLLLQKRSDHFNPAFLRLAQFIRDSSTAHCWLMDDLQNEFHEELDSVEPMGLHSFVPKTSAKHFEGPLHKKEKVTNRELYCQAFGPTLVMFDKKDDCRTGSNVVSSVDVGFVTEWNGKGELGFGIATKDGQELMFWADSVEWKVAWIQALERARTWDALTVRNIISSRLSEIRQVQTLTVQSLQGQGLPLHFHRTNDCPMRNIEMVDAETSIPLVIPPMPTALTSGTIDDLSASYGISVGRDTEDYSRQSESAASGVGYSFGGSVTAQFLKSLRGTPSSNSSNQLPINPDVLGSNAVWAGKGQSSSNINHMDDPLSGGTAIAAGQGQEAAVPAYRPPPPPPRKTQQQHQRNLSKMPIDFQDALDADAGTRPVPPPVPVRSAPDVASLPPSTRSGPPPIPKNLQPKPISTYNDPNAITTDDLHSLMGSPTTKRNVFSIRRLLKKQDNPTVPTIAESPVSTPAGQPSMLSSAGSFAKRISLSFKPSHVSNLSNASTISANSNDSSLPASSATSHTSSSRTLSIDYDLYDLRPGDLPDDVITVFVSLTSNTRLSWSQAQHWEELVELQSSGKLSQADVEGIWFKCEPSQVMGTEQSIDIKGFSKMVDLMLEKAEENDMQGGSQADAVVSKPKPPPPSRANKPVNHHNESTMV